MERLCFWTQERATARAAVRERLDREASGSEEGGEHAERELEGEAETVEDDDEAARAEGEEVQDAEAVVEVAENLRLATRHRARRLS